VADDCGRGVHHRLPLREQPEESVLLLVRQIAPRPQAFVKAVPPVEDIASKRHVRSAAQAAEVRERKVTGCVACDPSPLGAAIEASHPLECLVGLQRQHAPGHHPDRGLGELVRERGQPSRLDDGVVVGESDQLGRRGPRAGVARAVQAAHGLGQVLAAPRLRHPLRALIARIVVHDERAIVRVRRPGDGPQAAVQQLRTVPGRHHDGEGGTASGHPSGVYHPRAAR
jgi:hypothetical protein